LQWMRCSTPQSRRQPLENRIESHRLENESAKNSLHYPRQLRYLDLNSFRHALQPYQWIKWPGNEALLIISCTTAPNHAAGEPHVQP
jgi:hypothetical protein